MPKLWTETVEEHRRAVREATLDATAALVAEHGLASVTMSQIAERTGIGRAPLYKYFPDVDTILITWHERQVDGHLAQLVAVRDQGGEPGERLAAVLGAYALLTRDRPHGTGLAALLHRGEHVQQAHQRLATLIRDLIADAARAGTVRGDVAPAELAAYCLHAVAAAADLPDQAAVRRLVAVILAGLEPAAQPGPAAAHPGRH